MGRSFALGSASSSVGVLPGGLAWVSTTARQGAFAMDFTLHPESGLYLSTTPWPPDHTSLWFDPKTQEFFRADLGWTTGGQWTAPQPPPAEPPPQPQPVQLQPRPQPRKPRPKTNEVPPPPPATEASGYRFERYMWFKPLQEPAKGALKVGPATGSMESVQRYHPQGVGFPKFENAEARLLSAWQTQGRLYIPVGVKDWYPLSLTRQVKYWVGRLADTADTPPPAPTVDR